MRYRALSLALGLTLVSTAAMAQGRWYYAGPGPRPIPAISPQQAALAVRSVGFRAVSPPVLRGPYYVVHSVDRYGRMNRVLVDAEVGDVVRSRPLAMPGYVRPPAPIPRAWGYPGAPIDDDDIASTPPHAGARGPVASLPPGQPPRPGAPSTGRAHAEPGHFDDNGAPPPTRRQRAAKPGGSAHPTPPRGIPGVKPAKPAEPKTASVPPASGAKPEGAAAKPPRVVLPGGPPAKGEPQAAASAPAEPSLAGANPPAPTKPEAPASSSIPPMPPMQGFE